MKSIAALVIACATLASCRSHETTGGRSTDAGPIGQGSELDAVDESGVRLHFRVDGVEPDPKDKDGDVFVYALSVRATPDAEYVPYCTPDAEGKSLAIPVAGSWDARGEFRPDAKLVTFACTSGAIAKCIRFGYKPWKKVNGASLANHHLACMRMVRADYCGDGVSHTKDGTRIDLWDEVGVQKRDEVANEPEVFEVAWGVDGAVYLNVPRWSDDLDDIVKLCPDKLKGRTSRDAKLAPGEISAKFPGALMFNARFTDERDRMMRH